MLDTEISTPSVEWVAREAIHGEGAPPRVLLLGEDNPYGANPDFSLYCYPVGCSGYRLRRILGLPQHEYLGLHRANLCDGPWSKPRAKERARELLVPLAPWPVIVMLGRKVTEAMRAAAMIDADIVPFSSRRCGAAMPASARVRSCASWRPRCRGARLTPRRLRRDREAGQRAGQRRANDADDPQLHLDVRRSQRR
jgi:hypothetical protein